MTCRHETYAYFWIAADELPHKEISDALGLIPTDSWSKGDRGRYIQEKKQAFWKYESPLSRNEIFIDAHISALVKILKTRSKVLANLREKYEIGIQCVGYYTDANPGFHLSEDIISQCARLCVSLDFDLYCLGGQDEDAI